LKWFIYLLKGEDDMKNKIKVELEVRNEFINSVETLSQRIGKYIETGVRKTDYQLHVSIAGIEEADGYFLSGLSGIGFTYAEACKDYWDKLTHLKPGKFLKVDGKFLNLEYEMRVL
jgi:hypothetical protein